MLNLLYQHARESGRLVEDGAEWELPMTALRPSQHESNDRLRAGLIRLMRVVVTVPFLSAESGEPRYLNTRLFDFFDVSANERVTSATVRFSLPKKLQPVLARSSRWLEVR